MTAYHNASGAGVVAVLDDLDRNARINYDLACAREERNTATREDVEAKAIALRLWDTLGQARATIESARKALQLASRRFSDQNGEVSAKVWNDNYDAVKAINDALTAFGPAPPATQSLHSMRDVREAFDLPDLSEPKPGPYIKPATDATELSDWPEFRERRIALFRLWSGIPLDEVEKARAAYCYCNVIRNTDNVSNP